jgi:hypothetical protein
VLLYDISNSSDFIYKTYVPMFKLAQELTRIHPVPVDLHSHLHQVEGREHRSN